MILSTVKVNQAHLKKYIETNYFYWLDAFNKCLLMMLASNKDIRKNPSSTFMENGHYSSLLMDVCHRNINGEGLLNSLVTEDMVNLYLDLHLYMEGFIKKNHNNKVTNIYSVTIDEKYNAVFTLKKLGSRYVFEDRVD